MFVERAPVGCGTAGGTEVMAVGSLARRRTVHRALPADHPGPSISAMRKIVIPTRIKEKLPPDFAYTLWPTKVTEFLEDTPQRDDAELVFHWRDEFWESHWRKRILQRGTVTLVSAQYTPHWSPYYPKWKINIFSVPNEYLTAAQEILFDGGMQDLASRLQRHGLTPPEAVTESITMNLADWDHDETRLSPQQFAEPLN